MLSGFSSDMHYQSANSIDGSSTDTSDDTDYVASSDTENVTRSRGKSRFHFLYSRRMFICCLPGCASLLMLVGEKLLIVLTCGTFVVYLLQHSIDKDRCLFVFLITFICAEFTVLYAVIPLIWVSLLNLLLLVLTTVFSALSAAWLLLLFPHFTSHQPHLAQDIEVALFSLLPLTSVCFLTWFLTSLTTPLLTAYYFMLIGFAVGQWFLTPVPSSHDQSGLKAEDLYVLRPHLIWTIAIAYCVSPSAILIFTSLSRLPLIELLMQCLLVASTSISLATFFSLRLVFEEAAIPYDNLKNVRRFSSVVATTTLCWMLLHYGVVMSHWLPWLPVGMTLHVLYGIMLSYKKIKWLLWLSTALIITFYVVFFSQLTSPSDYYVCNAAVHISVVHAGLAMHALLMVFALYASAFWSVEKFASLLVLATVVFIAVEQALLNENLYSYPLMTFLTIIWVYILFRLHHSDKLPWQPALMTIVLHSSFLLTNAGRMCYDSQSNGSALRAAIQFFCCCFLLTLLIGVCVFETAQTIDSTKLHKYLLAAVMVAVPCTLSWMPLIRLIFRNHTSFTLATAFTLAVVSLTCTKLSLCHSCDVKQLSYFASVAMTTALLVIYVQPHFHLTWTSLLAWMQIASFLLFTSVHLVKQRLKSASWRMLTATAIGFPVGVSIATMCDLSQGLCGLYGLQMSVISDVVFIWWVNKSGVSDTTLVTRFVVLTLLPTSSVVLDFVTGAAIYWPAHAALTVSTVFSAVAANRLLSYKQSERLGNFETDRTSGLTRACTICTCIAFASLCLLWPTDLWPMSVSCCAAVLLLLPQHPSASSSSPPAVTSASLCERRAFWPVVVVCCALVASSVARCRLWTVTWPSWPAVVGCVELSVVVAVLPVLVVTTTVLRCGRVLFVSDRSVVFLAPLASVLLLVGSGGAPVALAVGTLTAGFWLIKYRLELRVDHS